MDEIALSFLLLGEGMEQAYNEPVIMASLWRNWGQSLGEGWHISPAISAEERCLGGLQLREERSEGTALSSMESPPSGSRVKYFFIIQRKSLLFTKNTTFLIHLNSTVKPNNILWFTKEIE